MVLIKLKSSVKFWRIEKSKEIEDSQFCNLRKFKLNLNQKIGKFRNFKNQNEKSKINRQKILNLLAQKVAEFFIF